MKKLLAMMLALVMVFSLAACGGTDGDTETADDDTTDVVEPTDDVDDTADDVDDITDDADDADEDDEDEDAAATGDSINVDVFWYTYSDTYLTGVRNSMEDIIDDNPSISATMHDCEDDQATQTEKVETAITQGTDLLVVNIVTTGSEEAAQNIVNLAEESDIPLIFFNREVDDSVVNSYDKCVFVGTDADEAGVKQGEAVANMLLAGDPDEYDLDGDGEIKYIMFRGEHGNAEAFGRTYYAVETANEELKAGGSDLKLVPSAANETSTQYEDDGISNYFLYGNWDSKEAANLMSTALAAYDLDNGDIELILANNDDQALGAVEAMNEEGYNTGDAEKFIPVFGVDATAVALEALSAGKISGTILQDGEAMANCIVNTMENVANGTDMTEGYDEYGTMDAGVDKIRIAYAIID